jgi:hypothetical protein
VLSWLGLRLVTCARDAGVQIQPGMIMLL